MVTIIEGVGVLMAAECPEAAPLLQHTIEEARVRLSYATRPPSASGIAPFTAKEEVALNLWAAGDSGRAIDERLGFRLGTTRMVVEKARQRGDARAALRVQRASP